MRDRIEARFALATPGDQPVIVLDTRDSATWPWAWYLRDLPVTWADLGADPDAAIGADVILTAWFDAGALPTPPTGWTEVNRYDHRSWWLPPWDDASAGDWFGWVTRREAFGGFGSLEMVELVAGRGWEPE
jgi:hypothetical protein